MLKIFDKYVLKSFVQPFLATFLVVLFVLVMQALWLAFDEIAGKGIDVLFILKFIGYLALTVIPMALPIGILLSSIMALGNLSENYEFAAIKSAGVPLSRVMRPLIILTLVLSVCSFFFMNNVYPWATFKQKNMYLNIKKKQPALALVPGAFNTEIPGYSIKFAEKYGEEENLLKKVQIADLSGKVGKVKVITAERGEISTEEGSKYMTLILEDGHYFEDHLKNIMTANDRKKMAASRAKFDSYTINIDVSSLDDDDLDKENIKSHHGMLSLTQLDSISEVTTEKFNEEINSISNRIYTMIKAENLHAYPDSLRNDSLKPIILENFTLKNKTIVLEESLRNVKRMIDRNKNINKTFKDRRKLVNLYDHEMGYRITFSLACLVLFFIGAPLGSIIRKGGFGLPMIMAIIIFVIYFFISQLGKNLAEESAITATLGSWLSTLILLPFGILLTRRATQGMAIFNIDTVFEKVKNIFKKRN
jgi:lipopolysaccharide export system permease protein